MSVQQSDIETIFIEAAAIDASAERSAFLVEKCGDDQQLRRRVEALLRAHNDAGSFLDGPPEDVLPTIAISSKDTVDEGLGPISLEFLNECDTPNRLGALGQYEVIEVIGRGGMGLVLLAHDTKLNRVVAIKVMAPELAANPMAVKRFLREAEAAAAVTHDHVVSIHAIEDDVTPPYLVMEFVDGFSLQEKIDKGGALELREILRIGMQTASGLAAAHKQGLVHRDIKPANILLENGVERVKITDFGLARAVDDVNITRTGMIAGTPQYMSPEQAQGDGFDHRSDLFALGSVMYAMCTGRAAFRADNPMAVMRRVCDDHPRAIHEINAETPHWLCAIIEKLLSKDAGDRFQSADEVAELLSKWLAHVQQPALIPPPEQLPRRAGSVSSLKPASNAKRLGGKTSGKHIQPAYTGRSPNWPLVAVASALLLAFILFGAVIMVATDRGVLEIRSEVGDVQVSVTKNGEEIAILDVATGSKVKWLASDDYEVKLVGDDNDIKLDKSGFEMSRLGRVIVTAKWRDDDAGVIKRFAADEETITQDGVTEDDGGWKITADKTRTVRLFETPLPELKPGPFFYHAKIKTENVKDRAYLEMWVRFPGQGEFFSKGFHNAVSGTTGWSEYQIPFLVDKDGQKPDFVKLNVVVEGGGTVWIGGIELRGRTAGPSESEIKALLQDAALVMNFDSNDFYGSGRSVRDLSGNGNDANCLGKTGPSVNEDRGGALAVDGDGLRIDRPLIPDSEEFTIAGWFKLDKPTGPAGKSAWHVYEERQDADVMDVRLSIEDAGNGRLAINTRHQTAKTGNGHSSVASPDYRLPEAGQWFFAAWSHRDFRFLNTINDHTGNAGSQQLNLATHRQQGPRHAIIGNGFQGEIDDVVVFNRALSEEELGKLYRWGLSGQSLPAPHQSNIKLAGKFAGHTNYIDAVAFTPSGEQVVTGGADKTLRVCDADDFKLLATMRTEEKISSLAVSPEGKYIATGLHRAHIVLWDAQTHREVRRFVGHVLGKDGGRFGRILSVNFSPDATKLISGGDDGTVRIWDVESGRQLHKFSDSGKQIQTVEFSPDGKTALGADYSDCVTLWNIETEKQIARFPGTSKHADFSPDGRWIAAGMWILDVKTHARVRRLEGEAPEAISFVQYTPDGRHIAMVRRDDRTLRLFNAATGREVAKVQCETSVTNKLAVSPDGRYALTGGGTHWDVKSQQQILDGDFAARLWRLPDSVGPPSEEIRIVPVRELDGHAAAIQDLELTRDGKLLISAGAGEIIVRDVKTYEVIRTIKTERNRTRVIATNPDATLLATGGHDGTLEIYDLKTGERQLQVDLKSQWIEYMDWSPDGKSIVMKFLRHPGGGFAIWDVEEEKIVRSLDTGGQAMIYSPDGRWIACGERNGTATIFDAASGRVHSRIEQVSKGRCRVVGFSADSRQVLIVDDHSDAKLWDVESGELLQTLKHDGGVHAGAFLPDGRHILTGQKDMRKLCLWDAITGELVTSISDVDVTPTGFALLPDGRDVATAPAIYQLPDGRSEPGVIQIWRLPESASRRPVTVTPELGDAVTFGMGEISWADRVTKFDIGAESKSTQEMAAKAIGRPDRQWVALGHGGEMVLEFTDNVLIDGPGDDLVVFESGGAPIDHFRVAISADGNDWIDLGEITKPPFTLDIEKFVQRGDRFRFVKIIDSNAKVWGFPGADIDAVGAINTVPVETVDAAVIETGRLSGHTDALTGVAWPTANRIVSCTHNSVGVWDVEAGKLVLHLRDRLPADKEPEEDGRLISPSTAFGFACSADGKLAATGHYNGIVCIWDLEAGRQMHRLPAHWGGDKDKSSAYGLAFTPDGKQLVTGGVDGWLRSWDVATGELTGEYEFGDRIRALAMHADGIHVLAGSFGGKLALINWETKKPVREISTHGIFSLAISPDGRLAVSGSNRQNPLRVWDLETGELLHTLGGQTDTVESVAFTRDGRYVLCGTNDRKLRVYEIQTGGEVFQHTSDTHATRYVAVSPDGKQLVTGGGKYWDYTKSGLAHDGDNDLRIWQLNLDSTDSGWTQLFNGRDLTGWQTHPDQPRGWQVEDGVLIGDGGEHGHLFTEYGAYDDFHLRAEVTINDHGNGGIYFRCGSDLTKHDGKYPAGYEAQILNDTYISPQGRHEPQRTGSLFDLVRVEKQLVPPDEWFTLEVIARDNHIVIKVNGETTADFVDDEKTFARGHIALQQMPPGSGRKPTVVQFRKIELKDLNEPVVEFSYEGDLDHVGRYLGHTDWISHVAYTSDGGRIVTSGHDETIRVWDASSGKLLKTIDTHNGPLSIGVSPDDRYVAAGMYQANVVMWDLETGKIVRPFVGHEVPRDQGRPGRILSIDFSADGKTLASCGDDGTVRLWDVESGKQLHKLAALADLPADLPVPPVETVVFSSDDKTVLAADYSGTVRQWNVADGKLIKTLRGQKHAAISPDGQWIVAGHKLFNSETNEPVCHLPYEKGGKVSSVRFTPDSRHVVIGKGDGSLWVYDVPTGRVAAKVRCNKHVTNVIAVSPDGQHIASGGGAYWSSEEQRAIRDGDYALRVWRLPEEIAPLVEFTEVGRCQGHERSIFHVAYAPGGKLVYSVDGDTLRQWNAATGELVRTFDVPEGSGWASSVTISPDGKLVLTGHANGKLTLWNAESGELVRQWAPHKFRVDCVAFTPDGKHAVSACATHFGEGDAGPVKVFRTSDWELAREFHVGDGGDVYGMALHPDSRHVLLSPLGPLQLRSLETGELVRTLDDQAGTQRRGVAIDESGQWALTGSNNSKMILWDLATGEEVRRFRGHGHNGPQVNGGGIIASVAFVPETNWLVSSGWDRTLRLWDRDTGVEIARDTADSQSNQHVAVSPDGHHVVTGGGNAMVAPRKYEGDGDYELRIWDLPETLINEPLVLPPMDDALGVVDPSVIINVQKDGRIIYLAEELSIEELSAQVGELLRDDPEMGVLIRADGETKHERVVEIISALRELGVDRVSLAAEVWSDVMQAERLKQIGVAFHQYHDEFRCFPPAAATNDKGEPLLSWRVHLLPFIDEMELYEQFHLDEPWDSEHNIKLVEKMPIAYGTPLLMKDGKTSVMVFVGDDALFGGKKAAARDRVVERYLKPDPPIGENPRDDDHEPADKGEPASDERVEKPRRQGGPQLFEMTLTDGASNTILLVQAGLDKAVPWTKPDDLPFDPKNPIAALGKPGEEGWLAVFADGAVHTIPAQISPVTLERLINPADGQVVDFPEGKVERNDGDATRTSNSTPDVRPAD